MSNHTFGDNSNLGFQNSPAGRMHQRVFSWGHQHQVARVGKACKLQQHIQPTPHNTQSLSRPPRATLETVAAAAAATVMEPIATAGPSLLRQRQKPQLVHAAADADNDYHPHHNKQQLWPQQQQQPAAPRAAGFSASSGTIIANQCNSASSSSKFDNLMQLLRTRSAVSNPALLTAAIKACSSWQQASAVFTEHSHAFNHIHTAAFISHMPKALARSSRSPSSPSQRSDIRLLLQDNCQLAEELLHDCSDRELVNIAHGLASLGFYNRRLLQLLLCRCNLSQLKPQELSNLVWAVAKLNHDIHEGWVQEVLDLSFMYMQQGSSAATAAADVIDPGFSRSQAGGSGSQNAIRSRDDVQQQQQQQRDQQDLGFKPQEICNIAWGLAVMQRRCLLHSAPPLRRTCTLVTEAWKAQLCKTVSDQIGQCGAADVAMCMWALAVLGFTGVQKPWIDLMLRRATELIGSMQGRHIAVVLWATSRLVRSQQHQQGARFWVGHDLSSSIRSSSGDMCLQQFAAVCFPALQQLLLRETRAPQQQRQQQRKGQLQVVCVVLLSCAHLGLQPAPAAMAAMLAVASQQLQRYAAQQQQQQFPPGPYDSSSSSNMWHQWSNGSPAQQQQRQQQRAVVHDLVTLLYGLAKLSFHPGQHFIAQALAAAAAAVQQQVAAARSDRQDRSGLAAAAGGRMQGKEVAMLLWSMVKLRCKPSHEFLWLMRAAAVDQLQSFSSRDIAVMLWSLGQMHDVPQYKWVRRMLRHFLARLDDGIHTAPDICQVLNALPSLPSADAKNLHVIMLQQLDDLLPQLAAAAAARFRECGPRELVGVIQSFARLGYSPGFVWRQQHRQRCEEVWRHGVGFSEREQQILESSGAVLFQLAQHQQPIVSQEAVAGQCTVLSLSAAA